LADGQEPPDELLRLAGDADCLISSNLPRARETLAKLSGGREVAADHVFCEAPLPAPPVPRLQFSPRTWGVLSRVVWMAGYRGAGEGRLEAEARAEMAADKLIEYAATRGNVLLAAHGWFNRMVCRVLRKRGWRRSYNGGDDYWSWRRYEPPAVFSAIGPDATAGLKLEAPRADRIAARRPLTAANGTAGLQNAHTKEHVHERIRENRADRELDLRAGLGGTGGDRRQAGGR
jgi:hypothetical protein